MGKLTVNGLQLGKNTRQFSARDLLDGHVYVETNTNLVYIANTQGNISAFSVCGRYVIERDASEKFVEYSGELNLI